MSLISHLINFFLKKCASTTFKIINLNVILYLLKLLCSYTYDNNEHGPDELIFICKYKFEFDAKFSLEYYTNSNRSKQKKFI